MMEETTTKIENSSSANASTGTQIPVEELQSSEQHLNVFKQSHKRLIESEKIEQLYTYGEERIDTLLVRDELDVQLPKIDREKRAIELPASLEGQERSIFLVIAALCKLSGVELYEYDSKVVTNTKNGTDAFCDGFLIGTYSDKPTKLDRAKKDLDFGKACAFALKIRGELVKLEKLELIAKNNFYFGNNPGEKVGNTLITYGLKLKMIDIWEDPMVGQAMYGIFLYLFEQVGLSQFADDVHATTLLKYTLKFDEVVQKFYQPIRTTKRGKTQITGFRKGKKPNPSPLLTKGEYNLIMKVAAPLWTDLDQFKKDWPKSILAPSKAEQLLAPLGRLYKSRFEFLQKFGSLTTKRLQEIRISENAANIKKVDVTLTMLHNTLKKRASPGTQFRREVKKLFETNDWAIKEFEINNEILEGEFKNFVVQEITASYVEDVIFIIKGEAVNVLPIEKETLQCLKVLKTLIGRIREFAARANRCRGLYDVKQLEIKWLAADTVLTHLLKAFETITNKFNNPTITFLLERFFQVKTTAEEFLTFLIDLENRCMILEKESKNDWKLDAQKRALFQLEINRVCTCLKTGENLYVQPK